MRGAKRCGNLINEYDSARKGLDLFDLNCWIGRPAVRGFVAPGNTSQIRKDLIKYGIRRAIVSHIASMGRNPEAGNRMLIKEIKGYDGFSGAAVIVPGRAPGAGFKNYVNFLLSGKIRVIRLFPESHKFSLTCRDARDAFSVMEEYRLPVVIRQSEADWGQIRRVCSDYPGLNVIIEGATRKLFYDNRIYYRIMEKFRNFYLETHGLVNYLGIDDIVERFGAGRLLFGTNFPFSDPNASIMPVTHGNFSAADKKNIAHGNIERLIRYNRNFLFPSPLVGEGRVRG